MGRPLSSFLMLATVPYLLGEYDALRSGNVKDLLPCVEVDPVSQIGLVRKLAAIEGILNG